MTPQDAAEALLTAIHAPPGRISVLPWPEMGGIVMRVFVDPTYAPFVAEIPTRFEGFDVIVEPRPATLPH